MKSSKKSVRAKVTAIPELRFEDQRLTSFAGLVVIQRFFQVIFLKTRLQRCYRHLTKGKIFDRAGIFMQLVIHVLLGYRELRDVAYYQDDPLVQRVLGLKQLPDVTPAGARRWELVTAQPAQRLSQLRGVDGILEQPFDRRAYGKAGAPFLAKERDEVAKLGARPGAAPLDQEKCLLDQNFIKDESQSVADYVTANGNEVASFERVSLG